MKKLNIVLAVTIAKANEILDEQIRLLSNQIDYGNQSIDAILKVQTRLRDKLAKVIELKNKVEGQPLNQY